MNDDLKDLKKYVEGLISDTEETFNNVRTARFLGDTNMVKLNLLGERLAVYTMIHNKLEFQISEEQIYAEDLTRVNRWFTIAKE